MVGRAKQGRRGFYYLVAAFDLISDPAAVAAGGARARGEAAAAAKAASDLPPSLPFCCRQHRKCLRWCRAMMPSITSASDGGIGSSGRRCRLHSASVAAGRGRCCRRLQAGGEWQQTTGSGICFGRSLGSVRSGSGSGVELTPEVDDLQRHHQRLHEQHHRDDDVPSWS